ncbi:hypothetical protein EDD16DRAFT_1577552 [Pisolithus croceorrhizus]|nr:hypothetical protein EDD16DRAFT_1577552 [Pisolithus croceorrhizus]
MAAIVVLVMVSIMMAERNGDSNAGLGCTYKYSVPKDVCCIVVWGRAIRPQREPLGIKSKRRPSFPDMNRNTLQLNGDLLT